MNEQLTYYILTFRNVQLNITKWKKSILTQLYLVVRKRYFISIGLYYVVIYNQEEQEKLQASLAEKEKEKEREKEKDDADNKVKKEEKDRGSSKERRRDRSRDRDRDRYYQKN